MQPLLSISSAPLIGLTPGTIVMLCLNCLLLAVVMVLFLSKKFRNRREAGKAEMDEKINEARIQELEWYREKRFLMESQAREKQMRLAGLVNSIAPGNSHRLTYAASRLFFLAEAIREERQHLGTDLSKLSLIDRRLRKLGEEWVRKTGSGDRMESWLSEMLLCRQMIQSNREDLRKSQNLLRNVLGEVTALEERARNNAISDSDMAEAISHLEHAKNKLSELPDGLHTVAKSTGEQAQALFKESTRHIPDGELQAVWKEQTALDLFSSKHRPGGRGDLLAASKEAVIALRSTSAHEDGFAPFWDDEPEKSIFSDGEDVSDREIPNLIGVEPGPQLIGEEFESESEDFGREIAAPEVKSPVKTVAEKKNPEPVLTDPPETTIGKTPFEKEPESTSGYLFNSPKLFEFPGNSKIASEDGKTSSGYKFGQENEKAEDAPIPDPEAEETEVIPPPPSDAVWATPIDFGLDAGAKKEKKYRFNPFGTAASPDEKSAIDTSRLVIFRSDNPEVWNTTSNQGEDSQSIAINEISGDVNWLGIKRVDTGEEVFAEVALADLKGNGEGKSSGFNGSNEYFYGARHLGFFSDECATEIETRFTYGGWGFGHLSISEGDTPEQVCGWNGHRIPNGTVFEFTLYDAKPERVKDDQIII